MKKLIKVCIIFNLFAYLMLGIASDEKGIQIKENQNNFQNLNLVKKTSSLEFNKDIHKVQNLNCGIPPMAPLGCKVGACVCDSRGQNCHWTFICN